MKVAIDVSALSSGHKDRGVGKYTKLLIESLQKHELKHSYTIFVRGKNIPENVDLVHFPYFDPFFLTLPMRMTKPTVVTIHDLIPIVFPDKFPRGIRGGAKWQVQRLVLKRATRVITDSENSKRDIIRLAGIEDRKIRSIHLAPDPAIVAGAKKGSANSKYFLYVGDLNWNKNIHGLLEGFASAQIEAKLVIVGRAFLDENLPETVAVRRQVKRLGLETSVKFVGHVLDKELGGLYASSVGCVLPSFYEGFGLPVLEAMACGAPVICATGSSLDEIAGPALRVDANDPQSITRQMLALINKPRNERNELISRGKKWSEKFTWKKVARETVSVYESCI